MTRLDAQARLKAHLQRLDVALYSQGFWDRLVLVTVGANEQGPVLGPWSYPSLGIASEASRRFKREADRERIRRGATRFESTDSDLNLN